jgi:hypothetical protein
VCEGYYKNDKTTVQIGGRGVSMAKSTYYPMSMGEYADVWKPKFSDNGDRTTYGYGACYEEKVVMVDGKPCKIRYMVKKGSRNKGAKQTIS